MGPRDLPQVCYRCRKLKMPILGKFVRIPGRYHDYRFICNNCAEPLNHRPATRGRSRAPSPLEKAVFRQLAESGCKFEQERSVGPFWVDFAIPSLRLAIEAQGRTYHRHPSRQARDRAKRAALEKIGWKVVNVYFPDPEGQVQVALERRAHELGAA